MSKNIPRVLCSVSYQNIGLTAPYRLYIFPCVYLAISNSRCDEDYTCSD